LSSAFSHCTAAAKFDSGLAIILAQNANRSWIIGVAAPSWPFRDKQPVKLVLTFDGQAQFDVSGTAARDKAVVGVLSSQAISALGKAHQLVVTATNQTLQFDLAAAGNVVPSIEYCVDKINTNGIAAAGDFSNPKAKPSTAKASAKSDDEPAEKPAEPDKLVSVSGSGFVVSKNAHIVTNNHVVTDCVGDIHGNLVGQAPVKLRVVSADEENDLALLQGTKKGHRDDPRQRGEFRRPGGCDRLSAAWASHLRPDGDDGDHQFLGGAAQRYALLADQRPGSAGQQRRPITRQRGNIVGVVSAKLDALRMVKATGDIPQNINFAIKTGALRDFLDNSAVPYQTAEPGGEMKTADIASAARTYTMLISCSARHGGSDRK
jgi:Trypsin-like peptidase domain